MGWIVFAAFGVLAPGVVPGAHAATDQSVVRPDSIVPPAAAQPGRLVNSPLIQDPDYSQKTDVELTEIGASWDDLSRPQKNALLREVKLRMAQRKDADGVLVIRTQRRYGRVYRSDGRYLKIETKVVQVRPARQSATAATSGFGVGFEQRTAKVSDNRVNGNATPAAAEGLDTVVAEDSPELQSAPVLRVSDPRE